MAMEFQSMSLMEAKKFLYRKDCVFVDLREKEEYQAGHLVGAINIPYEILPEKKHMLKGYQMVFLYCERGNKSLLAARDLAKEGYPVINIWGGIKGMG